MVIKYKEEYTISYWYRINDNEPYVFVSKSMLAYSEIDLLSKQCFPIDSMIHSICISHKEKIKLPKKIAHWKENPLSKFSR